ncbi:MAG: ROK family protein [Anaerolineae bacterium]|nr:ROK family protein [Anaerolineae bacterium]
MDVLGIDIGGSGIKGAVVDCDNGALLTERKRIPTPEPATPDNVADVVQQLVQEFAWKGLIGCGFPAVVHNGVAWSAANIDPQWVGVNVADLIQKHTQQKTYVLNDADAAGIAEMRLGAGLGKNGTVLVLTFGTGIGSAVFVDGKLFPNTEFGHIEIRGKDAEKRTSDYARQKKELSWEKYALRLQEYIEKMEQLISPDHIIFGGGMIKYWDSFSMLIHARAEIYPAKLQNLAGIIGAAIYAQELEAKP